MKNKFTFFDNFKATADKLPDDLRLKFYDAMTDYAFNGIEPNDIIVSALIAAIKPSLDIEDKRGGAREGSGRKSKEIKNNQKNQIDCFEKIENQNKSNEIKINQSEFENAKKTKEKIPPHPQENKNKNIYPPSANALVPPLPKEDDSGMVDIEELIAATPPKKRFVVPCLEDVQAYIAEKKLIVNGKVFLDYFTEGHWRDSEGKPVKNWKQKLITWDDRERRKRTLDAARGLLKTGIKSETYGKDAPL